MPGPRRTENETRARAGLADRNSHSRRPRWIAGVPLPASAAGGSAESSLGHAVRSAAPTLCSHTTRRTALGRLRVVASRAREGVSDPLLVWLLDTARTGENGLKRATYGFQPLPATPRGPSEGSVPSEDLAVLPKDDRVAVPVLEPVGVPISRRYGSRERYDGHGYGLRDLRHDPRRHGTRGGGLSPDCRHVHSEHRAEPGYWQAFGEEVVTHE